MNANNHPSLNMITNLQQLLSYLGAETPRDAGDSLYDAHECGPWLAFIVKDEAYGYESKEARSLTGCDGVQVGSIVEGSDAEVTQRPLLFPFTEALFEAYVRDVDAQACSLWDEANSEEN